MNFFLDALITTAFITLSSIITQAQPWSITGNTVGSTDYFGANAGSGNPLELRVYDPNDINFYTNYTNASGASRMKILGNTGSTDGFVGIGNAYTPAYRLDVSQDINAGGATTTTTSAYYLGANRFLWHNGTTTSVMVGVGAGGANSTSPDNTFVGYNAGNATSGTNNSNRNTFIGSNAGLNNTNYGRWNTFTGYASGLANTEGNNNAFYGKHSGPSNTTGMRNVYIGSHAGASMSTGSDNVMTGFYSGMYQSLGDSNVLVGSASGRSASAFTNLIGNTFLGAASGEDNSTGMRNTFLGFYAGNTSSSNATTNSTAIGYNAKVRGSNQMILGDNNVGVGIGLSDNATGPQNKLEINHGTAGNSGLRFRQLTSATTPTTNPGTGVLSVDASGDVVYVASETTGLLALITQLQTEVEELRQKYRCLSETYFTNLKTE